MKIHGIVYLIIGVFVIIFSKYSAGEETSKLIVFVWMGYAFMFIGIVKLILKGVSRRGKHKVHKANFPNHDIHHKTHANNRAAKFCAKCGTAARHFDNFCFQCGHRHFKQ